MFIPLVLKRSCSTKLVVCSCKMDLFDNKGSNRFTYLLKNSKETNIYIYKISYSRSVANDFPAQIAQSGLFEYRFYIFSKLAIRGHWSAS